LLSVSLNNVDERLVYTRISVHYDWSSSIAKNFSAQSKIMKIAISKN